MKRNSILAVATLATLLISLSPGMYGAPQTAEAQRAAQVRAAKVRAEQAHARELLGADWENWTAADCDLILTRSNWVMPSGMQGTITGGLLIELRSALPIREALLRQLQIKKHYDTMDAQQKLAFDKDNPPEIAESESDPILLYVERDAAYSGRHGNAESVDSPQQAALELSDGTLVMPIRTEALGWIDGSKILYSFPRVINGKPVQTHDDQKLNLVFGAKLAAGERLLPLQDPRKFQINNAKLVDMRLLQRVWFLIDGLTYNGKVEY